jgi:protein SCO1/2
VEVIRIELSGRQFRTSVVRLLGPLLAITLVATACGAGSSASPSVKRDRSASLTASQVGAELLGAVLRPANREPKIVLTDTSGQRYDLQTRNQGKVTLIYFGYTHCPDVCPTTMADIAESLRQSSAAVRRNVVVLFATVDPRRDSLSVLRRWLANFDPAFIGLRGSLGQIAAAERAAGVPPSRIATNGTTIQHSAIIAAYTPDRLEHVFYGENPSTIEDLRHDLPILVSAAAYS